MKTTLKILTVLLATYLLNSSMGYRQRLTTANQLTNYSIIENTWPKKLKDNFMPVMNKFRYHAIDVYNIDSSYAGGIGLRHIDTFLLKKIHSFQKVSPKSTWIFDQDINTYCYYSIDRPINHFFPIVLIKREKMGLMHLEMVLFGEDGEVKNIIQIGARGEIGRAPIGRSTATDSIKGNPKYSDLIYDLVYSRRSSDSTLILISKKPDYNSISDAHTWKCDYEESEITIHRNAKFDIKKLKTYRK